MSENEKNELTEDDLNQNYQLGISVGITYVSDHLMKIAQKKFKNFIDNADEIRRYAQELSKLAEKERPENKEEKWKK